MILKLAYFLHNLLGDDLGGSPSPPGSCAGLEFGEPDEGRPTHTVITNNDGYEMWICYTQGGGWQWHCRAEAARQLAWFILWTWWAKGTWFGLKRRIWYWANHTIVASYQARQRRGQA